MEFKTPGEYLEDIGWGKYNKKIFFHCGMAWATDMMWSANVAYILQGSQVDFNLNGLEVGLLGACFPLGLSLGSAVWGFTGDKFGRIYAFKRTVTIATIFSLVLTFSIHPIMSGASLILLGFGVSGELTLGGTVFLEFCPPSKLYYLTVLAIFWGFGGSFSALVALIAVLTNSTGISNWRFIVATGFVVEVICFIFRMFLEETPAFSLLCGDVGKTESVLSKISLQNLGKEFYFDERLRNMDKQSVISCMSPTGTKDTKDLLKYLFKDNLRLVLIFGVMYSCSGFAFTSILYFMPVFLGNLSMSMAYGVILLQQACYIPGVLMGGWLVETRFGRRLTIFFPFLLASLCCFLFYINQGTINIIVCTSVLNFFIAMGYSSMYTITPESYVTEIRNLGCGVAGICSRGAMVTSPIITGWMLSQKSGFQLALVLYAVLFGMVALSSLPLKETRPVIRNKIKEVA